MSDWHATKEAHEQDLASGGRTEGQSERLKASVRGDVDVTDVPQETYPDQKYTDARGRDLTMRTYPSGDSYYVRVFDDSKTPEPPEHASYGDAGRANLHLERDTNGNVERAKLQDIETVPSYREAGTGGRMLSQCEDIARSNGAQEIYGTLDREDERQWYVNRGYAFRGDGSRELYKEL